MNPRPQDKNLISDSASLAKTVDFGLLGSDLGKDVRSGLQTALTAKTVFPKATNLLSIFREALCTSIQAIETHRRGPLFQEFLLKGPYEHAGPIPKKFVGQRLSDE